MSDLAHQDLSAAAEEEMQRACSLGWRQMKAHTPWGDTFEGFSPQGRSVCFERNYLWDGPEGGDIRVEVNVYEPARYEAGVRVTRRLRQES